MGVGGLKRKLDEHESRIDRLERLAEISIQEGILLKKEMREFKEEMKAFREEMREFKEWSKQNIREIREETKAFKKEMEEFKEWSKRNIAEIRQSSKEFEEWSKQNIKEIREETKAFKKEMEEFKEWSKQNIREIREETRAFKKEMEEFKEWSKQNIAELRENSRKFEEWAKKNIEDMRAQWGHLARKMGTVAEDIVAPALPFAIKKRLNMDVVETHLRVLKRINGSSYEIDILAITREGIVFVVEVKTTFRAQDVRSFNAKLKKFTKIFPQYKGKKIVGIIASFRIEEGIVKRATKNNMLALAMSGDYMDFLNLEEVRLS